MTPPKYWNGIDIPRKFWGALILAIHPLRLSQDGGNVDIILQEDGKMESGLIVVPSISSTFPEPEPNGMLRPMVLSADGTMRPGKAVSNNDQTREESGLYSYSRPKK